MIPFNKPTIVGKEMQYLQRALEIGKFSGDGEFTERCTAWLEQYTGTKKALLTTSCTHALEMAAILLDIKEGDEIIMPSYTFVSSANAFILRGAKVIFVDVRPDTMNINERLISSAITEKTKAIVPVHYAGLSCEMDTILDIAETYELYVVEDAAQGVKSEYKGKALGSIGHIGCYSFHETKNYQCGEGGALLINDERFIEKAEIIREKGTNRSQFFRGQIDKYTWVNMGSSYLPSELNTAFLLAQLESSDVIFEDRMNSWEMYYKGLKPLMFEGKIELPVIPAECKHNAHIFYLKVKELKERTQLIDYLKKHQIAAYFHYVPLHSSPFGKQNTNFHGTDHYTSAESDKLIRLPLYYGMKEQEVLSVIGHIYKFYNYSS